MIAVAFGVVVAYVDGMKIGREHPYDWHDLLVAVRGPIVDALDREFHKAGARAGPFGDLG